MQIPSFLTVLGCRKPVQQERKEFGRDLIWRSRLRRSLFPPSVATVALLILGHEFLRQAARFHIPVDPVVADVTIAVLLAGSIGFLLARGVRFSERELEAAWLEKEEAGQALRSLSRKLEERDEKVSSLHGELGEAMAKLENVERERVEVAAREHKRIGEYLHDNIGQLLTGIGFVSRGLEQRLQERNAPEAATAGEICKLAVQVISETRHISRGFFAVSLESHGLCYALAELADFIRRTYGVDCRFVEPESFPPLNSLAATNLYRIAQEAINNAIRHGDATEIEISFAVSGATALMTVWNNGHPFSPESKETEGIGILVMKQRAAAIDGKITIDSTADGVELACGFPI